MEQLGAFGADLHAYLVSNGAVRPAYGTAKLAAPGKTTVAPVTTTKA